MRHLPRTSLAHAAACCALLVLARPADAQQLVVRLSGTVKNIAGQPIKAATVRAVNPAVVPGEFTTTSDEKGEWGILGLRGGLWEVSASSPGFESSKVAVYVAPSQNRPTIHFVLVGTPVPGVLDGVDTTRLQASLTAAETLMVQEKWDEAIAAYKAILATVPRLDSINLAIGRALTMKKDYAGAVEAYGEILKRDPLNQKALLEIGRARLDQGDRAAALAAFDKVVEIDKTADEAAEARALAGQIRR